VTGDSTGDEQEAASSATLGEIWQMVKMTLVHLAGGNHFFAVKLM
jgi:hypothetical protein